MTVDELARNLGVRPDELQPELDQLRQEGHVLEEQGRLLLVSVLAESITTFVRNNRGVSIAGLAEGLGVGRPTLEPVVRRLVAAGVMQRDNRGRLTLVAS
jgi:DNA-binding IclR family transcriptional regulator